MTQASKKIVDREECLDRYRHHMEKVRGLAPGTQCSYLLIARRFLRALLLLESKDADITRLKERLQEQLRQNFGRSSEKLSPGQLSLFREELEKLLQESKSCEADAVEAKSK
jgi:hypothetical protein